MAGNPPGASGTGLFNVGVARHDEVGQAVAVHVTDSRAAVPAERCDTCVARSFREVAVTVVPQEQLLGGSRDVEIGVSVGVEVAGDAARSSDGEVRARVLADVFEATAVVPVERRLGKAARAPPARNLDDGVRVDGEEVELAVAVVVEPAETRALHGGDVGCGIPPECSLPEVDTHLVGDVDELRARRSHVARARTLGSSACSLDPQAASVKTTARAAPAVRARATLTAARAYAMPRAARRRFA